MRQYPIWNEIHGTEYAKAPGFGAREGFMQRVAVGTSRTNSHDFATIEIARYSQPDGSTLFALFGAEIKRGRLNGQGFTFENFETDD